MAMEWVGCREGDIGDARGDETRGRFVLIASDMIWVVSEGMVDATTGVGANAVERMREYWGWGDAGVGERRKAVNFWDKRARSYKRMYVGRSCINSAHSVGVRVVAVGVLDGKPARLMLRPESSHAE